MGSERRYTEEEIAAIFQQAAKVQESARNQMSRGEGLTLAELQQIGNEVGITPEFIARAAASVDGTKASPPPKTLLGLPISVARTVELPGPVSDEDWERLVVDCRETFQARGSVRRDGSLRQWRNGNLHALVEPSDSGHRLRLRTLNGSAQGMLGLSIAGIAMGLVSLLILAVSGDLVIDREPLLFTTIVAAGFGGIGITAYRLRHWVEERGRQMEGIAARVIERLADKSGGSFSASSIPSRVDLGDSGEDPGSSRGHGRERSRS